MGKIELVNKEEFLSGIRYPDPIFNSPYLRLMFKLERDKVEKKLNETLIEMLKNTKKMKTTAEKIAVMQAYERGEKIICTILATNKRIVAQKGKTDEVPGWNWAAFNYDIAPKLNIRAYKNAEEVLAAIKEHGGYVKEGQTYRYLKKFTICEDGSIAYSFSGWNSTSVRVWETMYDKIVWADGAPFGVKIEED